MPGIKKKIIAQRLLQYLLADGLAIESSAFPETGQLPWRLKLRFPSQRTRQFRIYLWTVSHGGRTRAAEEYRIQMKLEEAVEFRFGDIATTLLLGYYNEEADRSGKAIGNEPPEGMEVIVAWDPTHHLKVGISSSCQVPFDVMNRAYLLGVTQRLRPVASGDVEKVIAMRPAYFGRYLSAAAGGHQFADADQLLRRNIKEAQR